MSDASRSQAARSGIVKSAVLHIAIILAMVLSFDFSSTPLEVSISGEPTPIIEATFIDSNVLAQKKREQQQAEAAARAKQEKQRQQRIEKEKARKEKAEREKRRKQKQAADAKERERKETERLKALEVQRQKEAQAKAEAKREAERQAQQKAVQQAQEKELQEQMKQEQAARAKQQERRILSETDKYISLIKQTIQRNLIFDGTSQGKECRLNIRLSQAGLVYDVNILSGDPALCRAAQAAVLRPDSLPVSKDPAVYAKLKDFNLTVEL